MNKIKENKRLFIIIIVTIIIISIAGGTLAYLGWRTSEGQRTEISFGIGHLADCYIDGGGSIEDSQYQLIPTDCTNKDYAIQREVKVKSVIYEDIGIMFDMWIEAKTLPTQLSDSGNFQYALTTSSTSCTEGVIASGNFKNLTNNRTSNILSEVHENLTTEEIHITEETYYLYIWLDKNQETPETQGQPFSLSLNGSCSNDEERIYTGRQINISFDENLGSTNIIDTMTVEYNTPFSTLPTPIKEGYTFSKWNTKPDGSGITITEETIVKLKKNQTLYAIWEPYIESILNGADPVLADGMIPVTISNTGEVTSVDNVLQKWYNYENKEWANAVLVNNSVRSTYINTDGTINGNLTINESDILAYYVWVPRYKYSFTNANGSPETINIIFENSNTSKSVPTSGSASGANYYTHPAFTFGTSELNGIWVGKFETTGDGTTPTIKPNVSSLRNQNVSTQFRTSLKFAGGTLSNGIVTFSGSDTYGLTNSTDSHMMKNNEWGAAAYLSHSIYGINAEVRINNNNTFKTGCGASSANGTATSSCQIAYGSGVASYPQSTTGNITGIFDMSGCAYEFTMGVYSDSSGNPMSGKNTSQNSGFYGLLEDNTIYSSGIPFPERKYYDLYLRSQFNGDYSTNMSKCTLETCGGQALYETLNWYGDEDDFLQSADPWWRRGGDWDDGVSAGVFYSNDKYGQTDNGYSWRSTLAVK